MNICEQVSYIENHNNANENLKLSFIMSTHLFYIVVLIPNAKQYVFNLVILQFSPYFLVSTYFFMHGVTWRRVSRHAINIWLALDFAWPFDVFKKTNYKLLDKIIILTMSKMNRLILEELLVL